jgi:hypothetical protein
MGGWSSGRRRTKSQAAVEDVLRLEMTALRRLGYLRAGACCSGSIRWSRGHEDIGSVHLKAELTDLSDARVVLTYSAGGKPRIQRIVIDAAPCRLGGYRFYFLCPTTGRRCTALAFVDGSFASRQGKRLSYASQSEDRLHRLYRACAKAEDRARGTGGRPMPRGANRLRLRERWAELDEAAEELFALEAMHLFRKVL